jgi:hypothetical protein
LDGTPALRAAQIIKAVLSDEDWARHQRVGAAVWHRILNAIERLQATKPADRKAVNQADEGVAQ